MKLLLFSALFLAVVTSLIPASGFALIDLNLDYPKFGNITLDKSDCESLDPGEVCGQNPNALIAWIYYFIVGIAGLAAFIMLVWGGVQWLTSGAIPSQAGEARDKIRNAILGLLLVLASFLIIQVINPELTILSLPGFPKAVGVVPTLPLSNAISCGPYGTGALGFFLYENDDFNNSTPGTSLEITCSSSPTSADLAPVGSEASSARYDPACEINLYESDNFGLSYVELRPGRATATYVAFAGTETFVETIGIPTVGGLAEFSRFSDLRFQAIAPGVPIPGFDWNDKVHSVRVLNPTQCLQ